jgi:hypothetical protein
MQGHNPQASEMGDALKTCLLEGEVIRFAHRRFVRRSELPARSAAQ